MAGSRELQRTEGEIESGSLKNGEKRPTNFEKPFLESKLEEPRFILGSRDPHSIILIKGPGGLEFDSAGGQDTAPFKILLEGLPFEERALKRQGTGTSWKTLSLSLIRKARTSPTLADAGGSILCSP
jgi:hypothetical protein